METPWRCRLTFTVAVGLCRQFVSLIYLSTFSYLPFLQSKFSCKSLSLHINEFQLNMMRSVYTSRIDIVFIHGLRNLFANLIRLVQSGNKVVDASSSCVPHCVSCCCCCDGKLLRVFFRAILSLSLRTITCAATRPIARSHDKNTTRLGRPYTRQSPHSYT